MSTLVMPVVSKVTPRFDFDAEGLRVPTTPLQRALFKYFRPLDRAVNIYVLSDNSVVTDLAVTLSDTSLSSTAVPYPLLSWGAFVPGTTIGAPEGAEGGPFGPPPPYTAVQDNISGTYTEYRLNPYLKYYFLGAHGPYPNLSANLVSILTAAKFDNYLH
jgi:hypothetical protein